jgi:hypothetical protein
MQVTAWEFCLRRTPIEWCNTTDTALQRKWPVRRRLRLPRFLQDDATDGNRLAFSVRKVSRRGVAPIIVRVAGREVFI